MQSDSLNIDERRGLAVSGITALLLLLFSIWYNIDLDQGMRPSFIEVEFGEFQSGQLSEFSEQQNEQVATRQNPSETPTEEPVEDAPEPENTPETPALENTKPVDLPDEIEEVIEHEVQTPETEVLDPSQNASEVAEEEIEIPPQAQMDKTKAMERRKVEIPMVIVGQPIPIRVPVPISMKQPPMNYSGREILNVPRWYNLYQPMWPMLKLL